MTEREQNARAAGLLLVAAEILDTKDWAQHCLAHDVDGKRVGVDDPDATAYCAIGAVRAASFLSCGLPPAEVDGQPLLTRDEELAVQELALHSSAHAGARQLLQREGAPEMRVLVEAWNDSNEREFEDVMDAMESAAATLLKRE